MILLSPMTGIKDSMKPPKFIQGMLVSLAYYFPKQRWVPKGKADAKLCMTSDRCNLIKIQKEPLMWDSQPRLQTAVSLLYAENYIDKIACNISLPFILIHGKGDQMTSANKSKEFFEKTIKVKNKDKEIHLLDDNYHCLMWQPCKDYVWNTFFAFLEKHCK